MKLLFIPTSFIVLLFLSCTHVNKPKQDINKAKLSANIASSEDFVIDVIFDVASAYNNYLTYGNYDLYESLDKVTKKYKLKKYTETHKDNVIFYSIKYKKGSDEAEFMMTVGKSNRNNSLFVACSYYSSSDTEAANCKEIFLKGIDRLMKINVLGNWSSTEGKYYFMYNQNYRCDITQLTPNFVSVNMGLREDQ